MSFSVLLVDLLCGGRYKRGYLFAVETEYKGLTVSSFVCEIFLLPRDKRKLSLQVNVANGFSAFEKSVQF